MNTPQVRHLMCTQCGAPFQASSAGGQMTCEYCGASLVVGAAQSGPIQLQDPAAAMGLSPEQMERARMKSLFKQMQYYDTSTNPYCYIEAPDAFEYIAATDELEEDFIPMALQAFHGAVQACQRSDGKMEDQRSVYWLARKLKNSWTRRDEAQKARAVIETAHSLLTDPGYRQLLSCTLADLSRKDGDVATAQQWLDQCDPRPPKLDLDSDYRTSVAMLHLHTGQHQLALDLVGEEYDSVPYEPSSVAVIHSIRAAALEALGRHDDAENSFSSWYDDVPDGFLDRMYSNSDTWKPALAAWNRFKPKQAMRDATDSDDWSSSSRQSKPKVHVPEAIGGWFWGIIAIPLVGGAIMIWDGHTDKVKSEQMASFVSTTGVVTDTGVSASTSDDDTTFYPDILYTYTVDGRQYTGDYFGLDVPGYDGSIGAQNWADSFRGENDAVTVYYDPDNPSECALNTTPDDFAYPEMLIGFGLLFIAFIMIMVYFISLIRHSLAARKAALL